MQAVTFVVAAALCVSQSQTSSISFASAFSSWPSHCCPLQLTEILFGTSLPRDAVISGNVMGKKWGYAVDQTDEFMPMFMSEDFRERPVRASPVHHCASEATKTTYEVLTNPNRCALRWYTTRYENEQFLNASGVVLAEGRGYMPAFNGYYFAKMENTSFGDLPSVSLNGETFGCRNDTYDVLTTTLPGTKILYVDCLESLRTMSQVRLVNVTNNDEDIEAIHDASTVYFNRTYRNKSNETKKQTVSFSAIRINTVMPFVAESLAGTECQSSQTSFADLFQIKLLDQSSIIMTSWVMRMSNRLGIDVRKAFHQMQLRHENRCRNEWERSRNPNDTASLHREVQTYRYSDDILVPANSVTITTATSTAHNGDVRYTITFELFPIIPDANDVLLSALQFFKLGGRIENSGRGTVTVHFDGRLVVDSAYEVTIHIVSVPHDALTDEPIFTTSQSLFPEHEIRTIGSDSSGRGHESPTLPPGLSTMTCLVH